MTMKKRYKFINKDFTSYHGEQKWEVGKWYQAEGDLDLCKNGFHCSQRIGQALSYVKTSLLAEVEVKGKSIVDGDKEVWEYMRITKCYKWSKKNSVKTAIFAARSVLHIFEDEHPKDKRPRRAIESAEKYLKNSNIAAEAAAEAAAADAASAAYAAADAASAAADADAASAAADAASAAYAAASAAAHAAAHAAAYAASAAHAAAHAAAYAASAAADAAYAAYAAAYAAAHAAAYAAADASAYAASAAAATDAAAARQSILTKIYDYMEKLPLPEIHITNNNIEKLNDNEIFVFGSNDNGNHAGGAARLAKQKFGAIEGQARGLQGQSYAIATLNNNMKRLPLKKIRQQLEDLFKFASKNKDKIFYLTKIGCGIAGFREKKIKDLIKNPPSNIALPQDWIII